MVKVAISWCAKWKTVVIFRNSSKNNTIMTILPCYAISQLFVAYSITHTSAMPSMHALPLHTHSFCKPFVCTNAHINAYMRLIYTRVSMHVFSHAAFYFVLRVSLAVCCEWCVFIYTCKFVCRIFKVLRYGSVVHLHKHQPSVRPSVRHTDSPKWIHRS